MTSGVGRGSSRGRIRSLSISPTTIMQGLSRDLRGRDEGRNPKWLSGIGVEHDEKAMVGELPGNDGNLDKPRDKNLVQDFAR